MDIQQDAEKSKGTARRQSTLEMQVRSAKDMLPNTQTKLGSTTESMTPPKISSREDQGDEAGAESLQKWLHLIRGPISGRQPLS